VRVWVWVWVWVFVRQLWVWVSPRLLSVGRTRTGAITKELCTGTKNKTQTQHKHKTNRQAGRQAGRQEGLGPVRVGVRVRGVGLGR
jgi:hypothetical protein